MGEFALGQSVPRSEDPRLVKGGGRFVDDMVLPGMVHGYVLRSPHANARIASMDTTAAKAAPGVLAVLTGDDVQASGFGDLPTASGRKLRDGSEMYIPPYPALVSGHVHRVGDYVAFIVAEHINQAIDAAELIEIEYQPLPSITSTADATADGAPLVWDDCPNNICYVHLGGDKAKTDENLAKADHVVSKRFIINRVSANSIEPRGSIGVYDKASDHYTIYTTLQGVHPYRSLLASRVLKVPESKVRVVAGDIGGSFGMKSGIYNEVALVLLASKLTGRPVKWISGRMEAFLSDGHGRDNVTDGQLAFNDDGTFQALNIRTFAAVGAYPQAGAESSPVVNLGTLAGVYTTPAIHVDVTAVFTNTNPMRPYRGNGRPEAAYVIERLVDLAADELGMDPAEIRRINTIAPSQLPYKTALTFTYDCGEFEKNMDLALEMSDYANFEARRAEAAKRGKFRGIGVSNTIEKAASPGLEGAEVRFDRSGTATILMGSVTQGQGHETVFKQLVCDRLGLDPDEVRYVAGDTDKVAFGQGTGGSRTATIGGSALHLATEKVVVKASRIAAHLMEVPADDVEFDEGVFSAPGTNKTMTVKEVAKEAIKPASLPEDMEPGLVESAVFSVDVFNFPNGCHVCELEIDPDTGVVEMIDYNVVDDVGNVMNPMLLKGQIHGGISQGLGQIMMENIGYDDQGQLQTGSFLDYAMPRADDFGPIQVQSNPVPTATNPLGVKGAGEAGNVGAMPAIANALVDALAHLGIDHVEMPATPDRLWRAISQARSSG